jgi:hypothetical protein
MWNGKSYIPCLFSKVNPMGTYVRPVDPVLLLAALGAMFSACSHSSPTAPSTSSITVTGTVPAVGQTSQLTAKATLSNGTIQDVTALSTWSSSNPAVATVTSGGLLRVTQLGAADITATYQGMSGKLSWSLQVTISGTVPPPPLGCGNPPSCPTAGLPTLTFNGPSASFSDGASLWWNFYGDIVLKAIATISGAGPQDVTTQAGWSSSNPAFAHVSATGVAQLARVGSADISATFQGTTGKITLTRVSFPCPVTDAGVVGNTNTDPETWGAQQIFAKSAGGTYTLKFRITQVGAGSCNWMATTYTDWVHAAGSGSVGDATVAISVDPLVGGPRYTYVLLNFSGQNLVDASRIAVLYVVQGVRDPAEFRR